MDKELQQTPAKIADLKFLTKLQQKKCTKDIGGKEEELTSNTCKNVFSTNLFEL